MGPSELLRIVKAILEDQKLAVLSTCRGEQPYSNLVCFAAADDLRSLVFVTPRNTHKYANLLADSRVAMLVDDRANETADIDRATAVTALGSAIEAGEGEREELLALYLRRFPHLETFASSSETALFKVETDKYIVVSGLRDVEEIDMGTRGESQGVTG